LIASRADFARLFLFSPISFPIVFSDKYPADSLPVLAFSRFIPCPWSFPYLALVSLTSVFRTVIPSNFYGPIFDFPDAIADDFPRFSVKHGVQVLKERELGKRMRSLVGRGI